MWNPAPGWEVGQTFFIGKEKNTFFKVFDYAVPKPDLNPKDLKEHYMKVVRELIFEEIRNEFFPSFPSRTRCLWVLPDNEETIKFWREELKGQQVLLKLSLTGKVFEANQQYLSIAKEFSLDELRQKAFRYWSGASGTNSAEIEVLFEGFAKVLSVEENPLKRFRETN